MILSAKSEEMIVRTESSLGGQTRRGFTLVEIAVSLAVLAFALVAVVGVLPIGINVQRENRERTVINEDARLLMEAMRQGNQALGALTNHVEAIILTMTNRNAESSFAYYFADNPIPNSLAAWKGTWLATNNPVFDIAALTSPRGFAQAPGFNYYRSMAVMRAMSGAFTEQAQAPAGQLSDLSFRYLLTVEVSPYESFANSEIAAATEAGYPPEAIQARNRQRQLGVLTNEIHEVRLLFQWPVLPGGRVGVNRQSYRTIIAGAPRLITFNKEPAGNFYIFQSQKFFSEF
jgi:prepilin-type N-terminal cleavage/methylation domain-containing protein